MSLFIVVLLVLSTTLMKSGEALVIGENPSSLYGNAAISDQTYADDFSNNGNNPYDEGLSRAEVYGAKAVVSAPAVAINTQGLLAPHIEILKLVETFLELKQQALAKFSVLINDNYDLIQSVIRLLTGKLTGLTGFTLKGIAILRRVMEFALNLFGQWTITLPSIAVGPSYPYAETVVSAQHPTYGAPSYEPSSFQNFFNLRNSRDADSKN